MTINTPQYRIQIRDKTLTPLGELTDFIDGDVLLNFNDVGAWVLTVRADDRGIYAVKNLYSAQQSDIEGVAFLSPDFILNDSNHATLSRDTTQAWHGASSLKVTFDGTGGFQSVSVNIPSSLFAPGADYTVSAYMKASAGQTPNLRFFWEGNDNIAGNHAIGSTALHATPTDSGWTRYSVTATMPNPIVDTYIGLRLDGGGVAQNIAFFMDGLQIERSASVTPWVLGGVPVLADASTLASSLYAAGNGVIISRDRGDGSGAQTLLSGPIWHLERRLRDNVYVLAGPSDDWWLKARRADPVTTAPNYAAAVNALAGLLRYYRLGEAVGPTATDSKSAVNGTYTGTGVTYSVAPGIDDSDTAVTFDGVAGSVTAAATALPTGAASVSFGCWARVNGLPGTSAYIMELGNNVGGQMLGFFLDNTGRVNLTNNSAATPLVQLSTGRWHFLLGTYDGTQARFYIDGVLAAGPTAMASNLTYGTLAIGSTGTGGGFFNGSVDEAFVCGGVLDAATIAQLYARGVSRYAASAYDTRTNTASTVIRGYVDSNAGPGAVVARRVTGLALAADPAIGTSVTGNERFDNLLAAIQQLALSGGDIGFRLVQTDVGVLTFSIYQPATQSNAIFSRELGNLLDATYTFDGPTANSYVIAGGGEGTLRICVTSQDATSVNTWGLVEGFADARDTSDIPTLQQRLAAQLAQDAQKTNLTITPVDTAALQFGRDYGLGDIVSVQIDGQTITDKIRQLHIHLDSSNQEVVSPGIGNAGAGQIAQLFDAKYRALSSVQQQVARLQTAK